MSSVAQVNRSVDRGGIVVGHREAADLYNREGARGVGKSAAAAGNGVDFGDVINRFARIQVRQDPLSEASRRQAIAVRPGELMRAWGRAGPRLANGSVHLYLGYGFVVVCGALILLVATR